MAKIHMVLQGKGGVGKSMIAATIAQYKASKGQTPLHRHRSGQRTFEGTRP
jgi:anion-transporting  ArsA/GET3 family ATPase